MACTIPYSPTLLPEFWRAPRNLCSLFADTVPCPRVGLSAIVGLGVLTAPSLPTLFTPLA